MYQLIYSDEKGKQIFFDRKRNKLAQINTIKSTDTPEVTAKKINLFSTVSFLVAILSNSVIGNVILESSTKSSVILLEIYFLAFFSGVVLYFLAKKYQRKLLDTCEITLTEKEFIQLIRTGFKKYRRGIVSFSSSLFTIAMFCSFVFYLEQNILLLVFTWLSIFVSVFFISDIIRYYLFERKKLIAYMYKK
ncbi:hypothetical protein [Enterococcus faecalis]|uniref:hypothetical protein n=1 Tax=Enterococcus faecalis TaxID=1351 RepID=UPI001925E23E|nr:hypothetical protein [Enterococcus faecalis]EGO8565396.1 hypothetical protein [Enterococcus faecalis]EHB6451262.1 hypothetical protein [Enterococcus faecalis]MDT2103782.1 hypothetical protein [Enterococcus faecalis]HAP3801972.1 hypothetical protein [Enterococcus faecalis]HAP3804683.1 hypothetical protein [Enterococcus faecalis]